MNESVELSMVWVAVTKNFRIFYACVTQQDEYDYIVNFFGQYIFSLCMILQQCISLCIFTICGNANVLVCSEVAPTQCQ